MEFEGRSTGRTESRLKLTEGLSTARKVDGCYQKVCLLHGKLMEVDTKYLGRAES